MHHYNAIPSHTTRSLVFTAPPGCREYGDQTSIMGSTKLDWDGLMFQGGEKDLLGWLPAYAKRDVATATRAAASTSSVYLTLQGVERSDALTIANSSGAVVTARFPSPNGAPRQWGFLTYRPGFSATSSASPMDGVVLNELAADWSLFSSTGSAAATLDAPDFASTWAGAPMLVDTVPSSVDQQDAVISTGDSFIYGQPGQATSYNIVPGAVQPLLIEVDATPTALPGSGAASTAAARGLGVRLSYLSYSTLERAEGRGCSAAVCQTALRAEAAGYAAITCGAQAYAWLDGVSARVAVYRLPAAAAGQPQVVTLSSCGGNASTASSSVLGVYTTAPVAQALYGASVGRGALAWSDVTVSGGYGSTTASISGNCGTLQVPLTSSGPLYIAVSLPKATWTAAGGILSSPSLTYLSVDCATSAEVIRRHINVVPSTNGYGWKGVYELQPGANAVSGSRLRFARPFLGQFYDLYLALQPAYNLWGVWAGNTNARDAAVLPTSYFAYWPSSGSVVDPTGLTSVATNINGVTASVTFACPPGLYSINSTHCAACPAYSWAPAGSTSSSACVCVPGSGLSGGVCSPCAANTFKASLGNSTCTACSSGYGTSGAVGATSPFACTAVFCDQYTVSGLTTSTFFNGIFVRAPNGYQNFDRPVYRRASDGVYMMASSGQWYFVTSAWTGPGSGFSYYTTYTLPTKPAPQTWLRADWGGLGASDQPSVSCTCPGGATPGANGVCPTATPTPTCPPGRYGAAPACPSSCPQWQVATAAGSGCECPSSYTNCLPPASLSVTVVSGSIDAAVTSCIWDLSATTVVTSAGTVTPVYQCRGGRSLFFFFSEARSEWVLSPVLVTDGSSSGTPARYAYSIPPAVRNSTAFPLSGATTWTVWSPSTTGFTDSAVLTFTVIAAGTSSATATSSGTPPPPPSATSTATGSRSGTATSTFSAVSTATATGTRTGSGTSTASAVPTATSSGSAAPTGSSTSSRTSTGSATASAVSTATGTGTALSTATGTGTGTSVATASSTRTAVATGSGSATSTSSATSSRSSTATSTGSAAATVTSTGTAASTASSTGTAVPTATGTSSGTATATGTSSRSSTATSTGSAAATATSSGSSVATATSSGTAASTGSSTASRTATATSTGSAAATVTSTGTAASTASSTGTAVPTATGTSSGTATATGTSSRSSTATSTGSAVATVSSTGSRSSTATGTRTATGTATGSASRPPGTPTATGTGSRSSTPTASRTPTSTATATRSGTGSRTASSTGTPTRPPASSTGTSTPSRSGSPTSSRTRTAPVTVSRSRGTSPSRTATPSPTKGTLGAGSQLGGNLLGGGFDAYGYY